MHHQNPGSNSVGEQGLRLDLRGQRLGLRDVMGLAAGQADDQGIAERIDDGVDFRREPAARAAYGFSAPPFLRASALCWCALTMVASIIAYSLSGSSAKVLKRFLFDPGSGGPWRGSLAMRGSASGGGAPFSGHGA